MFKDGEIVDMARLTQAVADLDKRMTIWAGTAQDQIVASLERVEQAEEAMRRADAVMEGTFNAEERRERALAMAIDAAKAMTHRDVTPGTVLEFAAIFESFLRGDMTETSHDPETGRAEVGDLEGNAG